MGCRVHNKRLGLCEDQVILDALINTEAQQEA